MVVGAHETVTADPVMPPCQFCAAKDAEIAALRETMVRMVDRVANPPVQMIAPDVEIGRLRAVIDAKKAAKAKAQREWRAKRKAKK